MPDSLRDNNKEAAFEACREGRFADAAKYADAPDEAELAAMGAEAASCAVQSLAASGRAENAARYYLKALACGLPLPAPWMLSPALRQTKLADLDVACWKGWSERFPDRPQGWSEFARALERAGRQTEALELLRKASGRFPGNANIHAQLGMSCLQNSTRQESLTAFRSALDIDPLQPVWVKRAVSALLREVVEINGTVLSVPAGVVSPAVLRYLVEGRYEGRELSLLLDSVKPGDRILELGAGLGYLACSVARGYPEGQALELTFAFMCSFCPLDCVLRAKS
jgi:tetratricopeptide (TPR) repeat protein